MIIITPKSKLLELGELIGTGFRYELRSYQDIFYIEIRKNQGSCFQNGGYFASCDQNDEIRYCIRQQDEYENYYNNGISFEEFKLLMAVNGDKILLEM